MALKKQIEIPENIAQYIESHNRTKLSININHADGDSGYVHMIWHTVALGIATRTCNRCGYDPLWNPNAENSQCIRHVYNKWRYDDVFVWSSEQNKLSLKDAFDGWLLLQPKGQPESSDYPMKKITFGKIGWNE